MLYAVRISRSYDELKQFFDMLSDQRMLVVFQHDSDDEISRTHVHALVDTDTPTDTMKYWIKKTLQVDKFPKTDWSFKTTYKNASDTDVPIDLDFITYMSKGNLSPVRYQCIDGSVIQAKIDAWVPLVKKTSKMLFQYKTVSEKPEVARKRQTDMLDPIIKYFEDNPHEVTGRAVIAQIVKTIREQKLVAGRYKIRDYYDYIVANLTKTSLHKEWIDDIYRMCIKI